RRCVGGPGVARGGEVVPGAELGGPVTARLRERHLQAILSVNVAHLDLELPVDAACKVVDDPPRFLPGLCVRHSVSARLSGTSRSLSTVCSIIRAPRRRGGGRSRLTTGRAACEAPRRCARRGVARACAC